MQFIFFSRRYFAQNPKNSDKGRLKKPISDHFSKKVLNASWNTTIGDIISIFTFLRERCWLENFTVKVRTFFIKSDFVGPFPQISQNSKTHIRLFLLQSEYLFHLIKISFCPFDPKSRISPSKMLINRIFPNFRAQNEGVGGDHKYRFWIFWVENYAMFLERKIGLGSRYFRPHFFIWKSDFGQIREKMSNWSINGIARFSTNIEYGGKPFYTVSMDTWGTNILHGEKIWRWSLPQPADFIENGS